MRDKSGRKNSFPELITALQRSYVKLSKAIENGQVQRGSELSANSNMISRVKGLTVAIYSNGGSKEEVHGSLVDLITAIESGYNWSGKFLGQFPYYTMLWTVSIAILCDVDSEDFKRLSDVVAKFKMRDKLLNFLIKSQQPDWMDNSNQFIQKTPYERLKRAIDEEDEEAGIRELKNYLKEEIWYEGHEELSWYDSHTRPKGIYFGYWSWESAALVKVKDWNDEKLKDNEYYPYDAVHW